MLPGAFFLYLCEVVVRLKVVEGVDENLGLRMELWGHRFLMLMNVLLISDGFEIWVS